MSDGLHDTVADLAAPLAVAADVDLVDVELKGGGSRQRVRVVVDRKGGVDIATCQSISKELSRALDHAVPELDRYTLEVTSPGTDYPLTDQRSFDRVEGRMVRAQVADEDGSFEVQGTVVSADADGVTVRTKAGENHRLAYEQIMTATQVLPW